MASIFGVGAWVSNKVEAWVLRGFTQALNRLDTNGDDLAEAEMGLSQRLALPKPMVEVKAVVTNGEPAKGRKKR